MSHGLAAASHDPCRLHPGIRRNGWLGGASYYRNLFSAVRDLPGRRIEPVLVTSGRSFAALKSQYPDLPIIRLPLLDAPSLVGKARRVMRVLSGRDVLM